jgi:hypothetical protein
MKKILLYLGIMFLIMSCTQNKMYRSNVTKCIKSNCDDNLIETYKDKNSTYDLTFVEFTERGNLFNREKYDRVIKHIEDEEKNATKGLILIVFAHGWHHNASKNSTDVEKFRRLLSILGDKYNNFLEKKVVGVYLGWRGRIIPEIPIIKDIQIVKDWIDLDYLTYWGRKSVATQVGNGGVTEVLLHLNKITNDSNKTNEKANIYVVAGHSLGSDVILTSMKNILLDRVVNTEHIDFDECLATLNSNSLRSLYQKYCQSGCVKTKNFADAIILFNPAVEANELLQIKTLVSQEHCYARKQEKLLHILTSSKDTATKIPFKVGQEWGVSLTKSELDINRTIFDINMAEYKTIKLEEEDLDTITIGHYKPFRTGKQRTDFNSTKENNDTYVPCYGNYRKECLGKDYNISLHYPVSPFEPISNIYVGEDVIANHTDIFNENTIAYMSAAVLENQYKRYKFKISDAMDSNLKDEYYNACYTHINKEGKRKEKFNFSKCAKKFYELYEDDKDKF